MSPSVNQDTLYRIALKKYDAQWRPLVDTNNTLASNLLICPSLGNDFLHNLTSMTPMSMRVDLRSEEESVHAHYSTFSVDTMRKHYLMRVSGYTGTAGEFCQMSVKHCDVNCGILMS